MHFGPGGAEVRADGGAESHVKPRPGPGDPYTHALEPYVGHELGSEPIPRKIV